MFVCLFVPGLGLDVNHGVHSLPLPEIIETEHEWHHLLLDLPTTLISSAIYIVGFKLFDADDVCRPDIWGQMFDFKTFNVKDI